MRRRKRRDETRAGVGAAAPASIDGNFWLAFSGVKKLMREPFVGAAVAMMRQRIETTAVWR